MPAGYEHSVHSLSSLELLSLVALLLISALLTGAEAAYFSWDGRGSSGWPKSVARDSALQPLLRRPHDLLVTLLVGTTLVQIAASRFSPPPSRPRCSAPWDCPSPSAP